MLRVSTALLFKKSVKMTVSGRINPQNQHQRREDKTQEI